LGSYAIETQDEAGLLFWTWQTVHRIPVTVRKADNLDPLLCTLYTFKKKSLDSIADDQLIAGIIWTKNDFFALQHVLSPW
jgi:hypothetical protein